MNITYDWTADIWGISRLVGWWLTLIVNLRLLHPEKQDSDDGDATTLIMMNEELWLSLLVLMSEGDDGDGDDHVGDDDVGDDDVGDGGNLWPGKFWSYAGSCGCGYIMMLLVVHYAPAV